MKNKTETKKKRSKAGWIAALIIVAVLATGGGIGWSFIAKEHNEAKNLPLDAVDFSRLEDGVYIGEYEGGMYKWRANSVEVTVTSGKVTGIRQLSAAYEDKDPAKRDALYGRVIEEQSLQVDAISGATLTSKGYLQAVENALLQAQS